MRARISFAPVMFVFSSVMVGFAIGAILSTSPGTGVADRGGAAEVSDHAPVHVADAAEEGFVPTEAELALFYDEEERAMVGLESEAPSPAATAIEAPVAVPAVERRARVARAPMVETRATWRANEQPEPVEPQGLEEPTHDAEVLTRPNTPSRADVRAALLATRPAVLSCAPERGGVALVTISIASSGRVRNATVERDFGGSVEGSCIARAVRTARFPTFAAESFTVTYPFAIPSPNQPGAAQGEPEYVFPPLGAEG